VPVRGALVLAPARTEGDHTVRLWTLYSEAKRDGIGATRLNRRALAEDDALVAAATEDGRPLSDALADPRFRASLRDRFNGERR